jgi:hypothetical protein
MGGSIKLSVRDTDNNIHNLSVYTSFLSHFILDAGVILKKKDRVNELIKEAIDIYNHNEENTLSPEGYGLVYVDLIENIIISNQSYTSLLSLSTSIFHRIEEEFVDTIKNDKTKNDDLNQIIKLYKNNLLNLYNLSFNYYDSKTKKYLDYQINATNLKDFLKECIKTTKDLSSMSIPVNIEKYFKFYNYDSYDKKDYKEIKNTIKKSGVKFTKKDQFAWIDWFTALEEY